MTDRTNEPVGLAEDLQQLVGVLVRRMRTASPARELSLTQVSILKRLDREGPATVADLARADKIRHQSAATAVATLVDRGLLHKSPDKHDLRRKLLHLTPEGHRILAERREAGHEHLADLLAERFTTAERAHIAGSLVLLRRLLD
ncbi:MarR family transcriptional regulator [Nocardia sp. NEAU-G5]|uniref:MarR family transcriptional regulator n=1 Tax=Nocardia albiluteola TaxID=2842303 RepID=A0ABS6B8X6_9NOCA|nr:MarR family transcriptional regulator [Nocardia albiluteola]MBU3066756.1 MarR family transcriptional regulator [Nocardia albiluteola]